MASTIPPPVPWSGDPPRRGRPAEDLPRRIRQAGSGTRRCEPTCMPSIPSGVPGDGTTAGARSCPSSWPSSWPSSASARCCPVLPLYVVEQGVDTTTLGVILAAWPAARLVFEPIFGWLADRTSRRSADARRARRCSTFSTLLPLAFHGAARALHPALHLRARGQHVRPGGARHDRRGDRGRRARRGLRPLLGGPDGRLHLRSSHRRRRGRRAVGSLRLRLRGCRRRLHRVAASTSSSRSIRGSRLPTRPPVGAPHLVGLR